MNRTGLINNRSTLSRIGLISLLAAIVFTVGCNPQLTISGPSTKKIPSTALSLNATVSNIEVINHQIVITGLNLDTVSAFTIKEGATTTNLSIESKTSNKIIANTLANVTFAAGKIFDFILSNASAAATYTVNFSLCDSTLGGQGFNCTPPTDKQVLSYDAVSGKWKPRSVNGLNYKGAWDPTPGTFPAGSLAGDYFIANDDANGYFVGDWIVYNGATYDHISNASAIISVYGRTGAVVAQEGDYNLDKLSDVDLTTTPPVTNQALIYNGTKWIPGTVNTTETDPTVKPFAKVVLPTCTVSEVLSSDGTTLACVADQAGGGAFSGTPNRIVTTDGSGALAVTAISDTVLGYLSGVTSNIQTQINSKLDWAISGVATIHPSRLNLTVPNAGKAVITDGSGFITVSPTTSAQLGYLSGVTSSVQAQLDTKISAETDPSVTAFAKAALPTCAAGEVLKANGTVLSCVVDNAGAGAYAGGNNFVVVTNGSGALSDSTITTTKLGYLSGVTSDIQTQLGTKQATISKTTTQDVSAVRIYGANATNYVELTAATLTGNRTLTFPDSNGTNGYVMSTNGAGVLSWIAIPSAPVTTVFSRTGAVVATAGDYTATQITNTPAGNIAAVTAQAAITELDTEKQSIATLAADIRSTVLTGLSLATSTAITAADSILVAFGKLQAQITTADSVASNKLSKNSADSITAIITVSGAGDVIVPAPAGLTSVVNKGYVDANMVNNAGGAASLQIGTLAARPAAAAGNTGRMYVANDAGNEAVYVSTGAAWIKIASNTANGTIALANGGTGSTSFTGNKSVVVNSGGTALVDGPSIDDTTAVAATLVKRGAGGEVYGQYVVPTTTVVENAACTVPVGTIAKDSAGNLLTCQ
jgi:hypothetical protein